MPKRPAVPGLRDAMKKKVVQHEIFLAEVDAVGPGGQLLVVIEPFYPKVGSKGASIPSAEPVET